MRENDSLIEELQPEEARWIVTESETRLYGDSKYLKTSKIILSKILDPAAKSGDLTAIYDFLEKQLLLLILYSQLYMVTM